MTHIFLQAGVGGMAAAMIAGLARYLDKVPKIIIEEPENAACVYQSIKTGKIEKISINEIYSTTQLGKLLHSVISGPYENKSLANNTKEKITKIGFDPRLRTVCKKN